MSSARVSASVTRILSMPSTSTFIRVSLVKISASASVRPLVVSSSLSSTSHASSSPSSSSVSSSLETVPPAAIAFTCSWSSAISWRMRLSICLLSAAISAAWSVVCAYAGTAKPPSTLTERAKATASDAIFLEIPFFIGLILDYLDMGPVYPRLRCASWNFPSLSVHGPYAIIRE